MPLPLVAVAVFVCSMSTTHSASSIADADADLEPTYREPVLERVTGVGGWQRESFAHDLVPFKLACNLTRADRAVTIRESVQMNDEHTRISRFEHYHEVVPAPQTSAYAFTL